MLLIEERQFFKSNNLVVRLLNGDDIKEEHIDFFYECYLDTARKKWGSSYLTRNFFKEIGNNLSSKIILIIAYQDNQMIASALNFRSSSHLYGRLWGSIKYIPYLHFELCYYQAINYAIKNKLTPESMSARATPKMEGLLRSLLYYFIFLIIVYFAIIKAKIPALSDLKIEKKILKLINYKMNYPAAPWKRKFLK